MTRPATDATAASPTSTSRSTWRDGPDEGLTRRREHHAAADAVEEGSAQLVLELAHRLRH